MLIPHLTLPGRVPPAEASLDAARYEDQSALLTLLGDAIPSCSPETVWQLPWTWPSYLVLRHPSHGIIAAGSLQPIEGDRLELRGIVVHPEHRGEGLASRIVEALTQRAEALHKDLVCVTKSPDFFARFGFTSVQLNWLSPQRRAFHEADGIPRNGMIRRALNLLLPMTTTVSAPRTSHP